MTANSLFASEVKLDQVEICEHAVRTNELENDSRQFARRCVAVLPATH